MRTLNLTLAACALTVASAAYAAGTTTAAPASPPPPPPPTSTHSTTPPAPAATHSATTPAPAPDYAAQCTSLSGQWQTAMAANATNKNLGKATAKAEKGKTFCASTKTSDQKKGVGQYKDALKLLGVKPS